MPDRHSMVRVGLTEDHGKAVEDAANPPAGVAYSFLVPKPQGFRFIRSPIKGYLRDFDDSDVDIVESVISPVYTDKPWVYSVENLPAAAAFNVLGAPIPRSLRIAWLKRLFLSDNCAKLVFWSEAGRETLSSYGKIRDQRVFDKAEVVYPSIRAMADADIRFSRKAPVLLFSGDFFRKGGAHVIDAFERIQQDQPDAVLWVCCDETIDFNTPDTALRNRYLERIRSNAQIRFGRVPRQRMLEEIFPQTDVYLLPTYAETFGFALLEAAAFGVPVITTRHFAIPEIVDHERSGYLIDFGAHDPADFCPGYVVQHIPEDFHAHMSEQVYRYLKQLLDSADRREQMGNAAVAIARGKFSIATHNAAMARIYDEALAGNLSRNPDSMVIT